MDRTDNHYQDEYDNFALMIEGKPLRARMIAKLVCELPLLFIEWLIRNIPGAPGFKLRYYYYKLRLKHLGRNVLIDVGVVMSGYKNISIADYAWIDCYCLISGFLGPITIGRRVHVAPYSILASRAPIILEDYVGISSAVRIYSNSELPQGGLRMSGPMVPERFKAFKSAPVVLRKDAFVGSGSVILPGVEVGEGAVIGANSVITKNVAPYKIVVANGREIGTRDPVTVPDI